LPTTAHQIRILAEAARDARTILYDLERSQQRKRLSISYLMRDAARRIKEVEAKSKGEGHLASPTACRRVKAGGEAPTVQGRLTTWMPSSLLLPRYEDQ
jgi:hypothetical protein